MQPHRYLPWTAIIFMAFFLCILMVGLLYQRLDSTGLDPSKEERITNLLDVAALILACLGILGFLVWLYQQEDRTGGTVRNDAALRMAAVVGTSTLAGVLAITAVFRWRSGNFTARFDRALAAAPSAFLMSLAIGTLVNIYADDTAPQLLQLPVIGKNMRQGTKQNSYFLTVDGWPDAVTGPVYHLPVDSNTYRHLPEMGFCVGIRFHAGYLGDPWMTVESIDAAHSCRSTP